MLPLPPMDRRELRPLLAAAACRLDRWTLTTFNPPFARATRPARGRR